MREVREGYRIGRPEKGSGNRRLQILPGGGIFYGRKSENFTGGGRYQPD